MVELEPTPGAGPNTAGVEDALVGRVISDRYRVISLIAQGGMGRVYRAEQQPLGRGVALKVLSARANAWEVSSPSNSFSPGASSSASNNNAQRFLREASISAQLKHPNTVTLFDYGVTEDDIYYIAMELLEGRTLQQAIKQDGAFSPERALRIAAQVCRSLREAHALGVVHRDLKPGNIFLVRHDDDPDWVKVLDFGLVKGVEEQSQDLTVTGTFVGSPCYVSPEQIRNKPVDFRTDIYSLGVILYQMLTGRPPFEEATAMDTVVAHLQKTAPPMSTINPHVRVPPPLEAMVLRCMAKEPQDRFASMDQLLVALKQAAIDSELAVFASTPSGALPHLSSSEGATRPITGAVQTVASGESARPTTGKLEPAPPSRWPLALGAAAVVVAFAIGGWVFLRVDSGVTKGEGAREGQEPVTGVSLAAGTALQLASTPAGASVRYEGEQLCEATPCQVSWPPAGVMPGAMEEKVRLEFSKAGYQNVVVRQVIAGERVEVAVELLPVESATAPGKRVSAKGISRGKRKPKPGAAAKPEGQGADTNAGGNKAPYKENPY